MKKLFLRISLGLALGFGANEGFAQQKDAGQAHGSERAAEVKTEVKKESVVVKKKELTDPVWFYLDNPAAPHLPGSYSFATDDDGAIVTLCPNGVVRVCAIRVTPNGTMTEPDATALAAIQGQIEQALGDGEHKPNVRLRSNL